MRTSATVLSTARAAVPSFPGAASVRRWLRSDWLVPAALVALSLVPAIGGAARLSDLVGGHVTPANARFFAAPAPVILHIVSSTVFSILGAFQFSPGLRRKGSAWHRIVGRLVLPSAMVVAVSGLWMTLTYPWPAADGVVVYGERLVFGVAMLVSVVRGASALLGRKYAEHGDWMIRAYAIGLGAGTQVFTHLPWFVLVDLEPGRTPRAIMMGLGWVINVAFAEWIIRRPVLRAAPTPALRGVQRVGTSNQGKAEGSPAAGVHRRGDRPGVALEHR